MPRAHPRVVLLTGLALGLLALTLPTRAGDAKKDRERLQGTWRLTKLVAKGADVPAKLLEGTTLSVAGDAMTMAVAKGGKQEKQKGSYKLDPSRKPKEIEVLYEEGPEKGTKTLGIYELDGDTFRLALNKDKRPSDFTTGEKSLTLVFTFQRVKK